MELKVISLNMWEGYLLDEACNFLRDQEPDVLLLQEVYGENDEASNPRYRTLEVLKEKLKLDHSYYVPGLRSKTEDGKFLLGNAILSKYPISETDHVFFNDPYNDDFTISIETSPNFPHTLQHAVIETPTGKVNVYNLHGTWDLDGDNYSEKRQQMSKAIISAVKGKPKVILAGDTNARPTNKAMTDVEEYLNSVFGNSLKSTFNMKHKDNPGYGTSAVDMMFVSRDVGVIAKDCPEVDVSDHLPLVVELTI